MDYSKFRIKACVDWIGIGIQTASTTKGHTVSKLVAEAWGMPEGTQPSVIPLDEGAGGAATKFEIRLQDPGRWQDVETALNKLRRWFSKGLVGEPVISAIEVALDAYSKGAGRDEMVELVSRYYRFHSRLVSGNRRFAGTCKGDTKGRGLVGYDPEKARRKIGGGGVIVIGNKTDDLCQRIYFKTTDKGGKALPESQHRARVEVTLRGGALSGYTMKQWASFRFQSLSEYFAFRKYKDYESLSPMRQILLDRIPQVGERVPRRRLLKGGGVYLYNRDTRADTVLNKRARDALNYLSEQWENVRK